MIPPDRWLLLILVIALVGWFSFRPLLKRRRSRRRETELESPDRPADPTALVRLARFPPGYVLVARSADRRLQYGLSVPVLAACLGVLAVLEFGVEPSRAIQWALAALLPLALLGALAHWKSARRLIRIDLDRAEVEFRNYTFITDRTGNETPASRFVPFSDLLSTRVITAHGAAVLEVKTRQGRILIGSELQRFLLVVALLRDAVEVNRSSPVDFRDTADLAPKKTTSALEIALTVLVVAGIIAYYSWRKN